MKELSKMTLSELIELQEEIKNKKAEKLGIKKVSTGSCIAEVDDDNISLAFVKKVEGHCIWCKPGIDLIDGEFEEEVDISYDLSTEYDSDRFQYTFLIKPEAYKYAEELMRNFERAKENFIRDYYNNIKKVLYEGSLEG